MYDMDTVGMIDTLARGEDFAARQLLLVGDLIRAGKPDDEVASQMLVATERASELRGIACSSDTEAQKIRGMIARWHRVYAEASRASH